MTTDPIDDLLDRSAPSLVDRGTMTDEAYRQMIREAHDRVGSPRHRRRTMAGVAALVAGTLVASGGVAVAAGLVTWPAGFENPDAEFAFTLPSGRACEVRMVMETATGEVIDPEISEVQTEVAQWLQEGDYEGKLEMDRALADANRILAEQEALYGTTILIDEEGWLMDAALADRRPTDDDVYAFAVDQATHNAMDDFLQEHEIPEVEWDFALDGGVKCAE